MAVWQWDKKLHKLRGFCVNLLENHIQSGIMGAPEFDILGIAPLRWHCAAMCLSLILQSAQRHGILKLGAELGVLSEKLQNPGYRQRFVAMHSVPVDLWDVMPFAMPDPDTAPSRRVAPPTI